MNGVAIQKSTSEILIMCLIKSLFCHRHFVLHLLCSTQRKHFFRWLKSLQPDYLLDQPSAWLTFDAIEFLKSHLREGMQVFEYGSGGSTLFWLSYGASCVSIEHDPNWYNLMQPRFEGVDRIDYRLVLPEPVENNDARDIADPSLYLSEDVSFNGYNFKNYVSQIDAFPDDFFDIVLVDGRSRPACIMHSVGKVKRGGMLILDNSERDYYRSKTRSYLNSFDEKEFRGAIPANPLWSATTIFTKAHSS